MSDDDRTWEATHERTPHDNLRALIRHLDVATPTAEIARLAFIRIPGAGDPRAVETIREAFAREHALARAERWLTEQDDPPTITIPDCRGRPCDDGNTVAIETVREAVEFSLGARSPRACLDDDPDSIVDCTGPDGPGYQCPTCGQQRRREDAMLDELLKAVTRDRLGELALLTATDATHTTDRSTERQPASDDETDFSTETQQTSAMARTPTDDEQTEVIRR